MAKRRPNPPQLSAEAVRNIALAVIALIVFSFAVRALLSYANTSDLFSVKEIVIAESLGAREIPELSKLKGKNIFAVSIDKVEQKIRVKYPGLADLKVVRRLPDQILVTAVKRVPFARLSLNGASYLVDRNGFLIRTSGQDEEPLPVVKGLSPQKPVIGEAVRDSRLSMACQVIEFFRRDVMLSAVPLRSVDVGDTSKIICAMGSDETSSIDLILDPKTYMARAQVLGTLLTHSDVNLLEVKYIDLRFDEPLIGKKKVKKP